MPWIIAAGAIGGALIGSSGSSKAADTAAASADRAAQVQWDMYEQSRLDQEPWRQAGERALPTLEEMSRVGMDPYYTSPAKSYRMAEALGAIGNSPMGNRLAPHQLGGALNLVSQHADTEFGNDMSRLSQLAGFGPMVNQMSSTLGAQAAGNIGSAYMQSGAAQAQNQQNQARMWGGVVPQLAQAGLGAYQNWQTNNPSSPNYQPPMGSPGVINQYTGWT